jgi:hypothetical protein
MAEGGVDLPRSRLTEGRGATSQGRPVLAMSSISRQARPLTSPSTRRGTATSGRGRSLAITANGASSARA